MPLASALLVAALASVPAAGKLPLLDRVIELVRQNHDPGAVRGPLAVTAAFEAWARADERLEVRGGPPERPASLELRAGGGVARLDLRDVRSIAQVASAIRTGIGRVAALGLALGPSEPRLVDGLLLALDPHCALLPPGSIGEGAADVGVRVGRAGGRTVIREVSAGSPAERAGVAAGAAIVAIDGESTVGIPGDRVADRLRGQAGSAVRIEVEDHGGRRTFTLQRQVGASPLVVHRRVEGVGYVRLTRFAAGAARAVNDAVSALQREGVTAGLVLDLRGNPGGLVDEAVEVADLFLERGLIVETVGSGGRIREARWAMPGALSPPLVLLVDGDTASAAEIVAGALSLHGRAALAGDRTYGKGSVQVLYELPGGFGLKLTVAEYRLARGTSLRTRGLSPDAVLRALRPGGTEPAGFAPSDLGGSAPPAGPVYVARADPSEDPLVRAAARAIAGAPAALEPLRERLRGETAAVGAREERRVARLLSAFGTDWSPGVKAARPRLSVKATASRLAGDRVDLTIAVHSEGPAAARLRLWTRSPWLPLDRRELAVGRLAKGQTFRGRLTFDAAGPRPARVPVTVHVDGEAGEVLRRTVVLEVPGALSAGP